MKKNLREPKARKHVMAHVKGIGWFYHDSISNDEKKDSGKPQCPIQIDALVGIWDIINEMWVVLHGLCTHVEYLGVPLALRTVE